MRFLHAIAHALQSVWGGLRVTLHNTLERPTTVQYPYERLPLSERFRGQVVMLDTPELGGPACIACEACVRVCPADCISFDAADVTWDEPKKRKRTVSEYRIDWGMCVNCGFCVETCPANCLTFLRDYELSSYDRGKLLYVYRNPVVAKYEEPKTPFGSVR
jgi:NAD(P)H-quinone oxidoreductase subunit I